MACNTANARHWARTPSGAATSPAGPVRCAAVIAASLLLLSGCGFVKELVGIEDDTNPQIADATSASPAPASAASENAAPTDAPTAPVTPTAAAVPPGQPAVRDPTLPWLDPNSKAAPPEAAAGAAQPAAMPIPAVPQPANRAVQAPKSAAAGRSEAPRVQPRLVPQPVPSAPAAPRVPVASQSVFALAPTTPATPVAATVPSATASGGAGPARGFAAHLASYRIPENAEYGWKALKRQFPAVLEGQTRLLRSVDLGVKGQFLRLLVGPFETEAQSKEICRPVRRAGKYCRVLRVSR